MNKNLSLLSKPKNGWCTFKLGSLQFELSYVISGMPTLWLKSLKFSLENNTVCCLIGDMEPGDFYFMPGWIYSMLIIDIGNRVTKTINIDMFYVASAIYNDISNNIDEWSRWEACVDKEIKAYKLEIEKCLNELKEVMNKIIDNYSHEVNWMLDRNHFNYRDTNKMNEETIKRYNSFIKDNNIKNLDDEIVIEDF